MAPRKHETILNWSPVMDMALVRPQSKGRAKDYERDSINFTSGSQPFGALSELRIGIEALVMNYTSMEDLGFEQTGLSGATGLWVVSSMGGGGLIIFISIPGSTIIFNNLGERGPVSITKASDFPAGDEETLLVACAKNEWMVHVTSSSITLLKGILYEDIKVENDAMDEGEDTTCTTGTFEHQLSVLIPEHSSIVMAAFSEASSMLFTIFHGPDTVFLEMRALKHRDENLQPFQVGDAMELEYQPTSISTFITSESNFVVVGTRSDSLHMYRASEEGLMFAGEYRFVPNQRSAVLSGIESMQFLSSRHHTSGKTRDHILTCGFRDGTVKAVPISIVQSRVIGEFDLRETSTVLLNRCRMGT